MNRLAWSASLLFGRLSTLVFTLVTLYFVYLNRDALRTDVPAVSCRLFGPTVAGLLAGRRRNPSDRRRHRARCLRRRGDHGGRLRRIWRGTPDPIRSRDRYLCDGSLCRAGGIRRGSALLGSQGAVGPAVGVLVAGSIVLFIADHFVRPMIIGDGAKLPFLWVLLGILGGIESFGLVGIFLGPALMAALVSLWRGWVAEPQPQPGIDP